MIEIEATATDNVLATSTAGIEVAVAAGVGLASVVMMIAKASGTSTLAAATR